MCYYCLRQCEWATVAGWLAVEGLEYVYIYIVCVCCRLGIQEFRLFIYDFSFLGLSLIHI